MRTNNLLIVFILFITINGFGLPAFPGAEGWGANTPGGRGPAPQANPPKVLLVTNRNVSGAGSFSQALNTKGPRIIIFRVSGVITADDNQRNNLNYLQADESYVTIAGQTSPGGVTLQTPAGSILWSLREGFHDAVFRFLRFRATAQNEDAITIAHTSNWIIDHCDFSGATDETVDCCYNHHFTIQWSTIANSLGGGDGPTRNKGLFIAYQPTSHISVLHNLLAHHNERAGLHTHWGVDSASGYNYDYYPDSGQIDYRNNVVYDSRQCIFVDIKGTVPINGVETPLKGQLIFNLVGNYFKAGPQTGQSESYPCNASGGIQPVSIPSAASLYQSDNYWVQQNGQPATDVLFQQYNHPALVFQPYHMGQTTTYTAQEAYNRVLDKVGAWPRDSMNVRTVNDVRTGTGVFQKADDPLITSGPLPPTDSDMDGMPDFWEEGMGLNKNDASDAVKDKDGDGYTNIEEYINDLANARLCQSYKNPVYPIPADWPDYNPACCKPVEIEKISEGKNMRQTMEVNYNPCSGKGTLRIKLPGTKQGLIEIVNVRGIIAARLSLINGEAVLNHGTLTSGLYMVRAVCRKESGTLKMVMIK